MFIIILILLIIYLLLHKNEPFTQVLKAISYKQWDKYKRNGGKGIPKIIFRTSYFEWEALPPEIKQVLDESSEMCPEYQQVYLSDQDCISFITEFYPQYFQLYSSLIPGAFKADFIRLLLLYKYGGIYNDMGHTYIKPITNIIHPEDELVLIIESDRSIPYALHNAFMAAYPEHPVIQRMIEEVTNNIRNRYYGKCNLDVTGPMTVGKAYNKFMNRNETEPMIHGNHIENGYKIKLLQTLVLENQFILDGFGNQVIRTKFPNYNHIMYYGRNVQRYGELWESHNIYI